MYLTIDIIELAILNFKKSQLEANFSFEKDLIEFIKSDQ